MIFFSRRRCDFIFRNDVVSGGTVKKTDDPNIFHLVDEKGEMQGLVHLAWSSESQGKGALCVDWNDGTFVKMNKLDNVAMG